jgi:ADP-heptose:LPS heptosyltransferase
MFFKNIISNSKNTYRLVKADLIDRIYLRNYNFEPKTLLIIKLDAIGDYILFRNFLQEIKTSKRYKNYKITLLGNQLWRDISVHFDAISIDEFIWINPTDLDDYNYRRVTEKKIFDLKFEEVVYPTYSRTDLGDSLVIRSGAKLKTSFNGDARNFAKDNKKIKNDRKYDVLLDVNDTLSFEFYKYINFFSNLLSIDLTHKKSVLIEKNKVSKKIVFSMGASASSRRWNVEKFHELAIQLLNTLGTDYTLYLCGSSGESILVNNFKVYSPELNVVDLTGKQSLVEFIHFVSDAYLVVSNDSGPLHIAAACNVNVVALSNGNNFARFVPYPKGINDKVITIFPEVLKNISDDYNKIKQLQDNDSTYNINDISIEQVMNELNTIL